MDCIRYHIGSQDMDNLLFQGFISILMDSFWKPNLVKLLCLPSLPKLSICFLFWSWFLSSFQIFCFWVSWPITFVWILSYLTKLDPPVQDWSGFLPGLFCHFILHTRCDGGVAWRLFQVILVVFALLPFKICSTERTFSPACSLDGMVRRRIRCYFMHWMYFLWKAVHNERLLLLLLAHIFFRLQASISSFMFSLLKGELLAQTVFSLLFLVARLCCSRWN